jgi:hypothetical protein
VPRFGKTFSGVGITIVALVATTIIGRASDFVSATGGGPSSVTVTVAAEPDEQGNGNGNNQGSGPVAGSGGQGISGQESPDGHPFPRPVITKPQFEVVDCGLRITAYITHAESADVVYTATGYTNAGPGGTQVAVPLAYDGEIWSAVIYPNHSDNRGRFSTTIRWHIEAVNGPVKAAPSTIVDTGSISCYASSSGS